MAKLNIWGPEGPKTTSGSSSSFKDDIVGRFRSGYQLNDRPAALTDWRVTTGDPKVAEAVHELLGGDKPQEWAAKGEDNLEVFTASESVDIIIEKPSSLRQQMVLWGRNGKLIEASDGETITFPEEKKGSRDADADLTFQERKQKARDGIGKEPQIELYFRLAEDTDLGIFKFQTGSWSFASDLAYNKIVDQLEEIHGPTKAKLALEQVSFVAKSGPRAGQTVSYTKPTLEVVGAVEG